MAYTPEQRKNIKKVIRTLNKQGATPMEKKAAIETIGVEKNYIHTAGGDRDSGGAYQQRPSQGWGPVGESIQKDTDQFLAAARKLRKTGNYSTAGELAAAVQRPAEQYRGRYQERSAEADRILARFDNGGSPNANAKYSSPSFQSTPGVDNTAQRQQLQQGYLLDRGKPDALLQLALGLSNAQDVAPTTTLTPGKRLKRNNPGGPGDPYDGKVTLAPGADRPGAPTHKRILRFIKDVSDRANEPLTIGTGTNHSQYSVSGNVSDHWVGRGADVPASGGELVKLGRKALIAAGMPKAQARKQTGGLFNVNGYQIIFNTQEGGDHTDHLHVGFRQGR